MKRHDDCQNVDPAPLYPDTAFQVALMHTHLWNSRLVLVTNLALNTRYRH